MGWHISGGTGMSVGGGTFHGGDTFHGGGINGGGGENHWSSNTTSRLFQRQRGNETVISPLGRFSTQVIFCASSMNQSDHFSFQ